MKKVLVILLALVMVFSASAAFAGGGFRIEEHGVELDIPEGLVVLTRDMDTLTDDAAQAGLDLETVIAVTSGFAKNDIYLDLIAPDLSVEWVVSVEKSDARENLLNYSDDELEKLAADTIKAAPEGGEYTGAEIYKTEHANWIVGEGYIAFEDGSRTNFMQAFTVYNDAFVAVQLQTVYEDYDDADIATLLEIVDSVRFDEAPMAPAAGFDGWGIVIGAICAAIVGGLIGLIAGLVNKKRKAAGNVPLDRGDVK